MTVKPPNRGHATSTRRTRAAARTATRSLRTRRRRRRDLLIWAAALTGLAALVAAMMISSRTAPDTEVRPAPTFTLTDTDGNRISLTDYRGQDVVLYFNEGAGCLSCFYQMAEFERQADDITQAAITILPIVVNGAEETLRDMATAGVRTPFLLDTDKAVSRAYGTLDRGMHPGLPGHSFVLIDSDGLQRWYGEYPSMYVSTTDLLQQVGRHLR
jgi:peroxiredoxin